MTLLALFACSLAARSDGPCAGWSSPRSLGTVRAEELVETSGLARGDPAQALLWAHNDSGSGPYLHALDLQGAPTGRVRLVDEAGAPHPAIDWEDLARGPGPDGRPWLFVADSGNNKLRRADIAILRLPEPELDDRPDRPARRTVHPWPGEPLDAEALFADPLGEGLVLLSKEKGRARAFQVPDDDGPLRPLAELRLPEGERLTGADIRPDGRQILLRTKASVLLIERAPGQSIAAALAGPTCALPAPPETQGEAIAATAEGFLTIGEGAGAAIFEVRAP